MKTLTHRTLFALVLFASPLLATAGGAYYGYYGPPQLGYQPRPVYPYAYVPRPYVVQPYAYGGYYRPHGWHQQYRGHRHGWRGNGWGGGWRGGWGGGWGGGYPRSGFSFHYSN